MTRQDTTVIKAIARGIYPAAVAGLALLALLLLAYPLVRTGYSLEINYNEGWNAFHQIRAAAGERLYSGLPPLVFNNYPPLSFYLVGAAGQAIGDVNLAGRLLSWVGLGLVLWAIAKIVRHGGGQMLDAVLAITTFVLVLAVFYDPYLGTNDPQILGMGFGAAALALHLGGVSSAPRVALIAALLMASVLTKHNLLALPLIVAADLLLRGDKRVRLAFIGTGLALGAAVLALLLLREGNAAFAQVLAPREWSLSRALRFDAEVLTRHQALVLLVAIGLALVRTRAALIIGAYAAAALVLAAYFAGGSGTAENIYFDLLLALAIGAGLVAAQLRGSGASGALMAAAAIGLNLAALIHAPFILARDVEDYRGGMMREQARFNAEAAWLRARAGPALCESLLLCQHAGKAVQVDPFNALQAERTGRLPPGTLAAQIAEQRFAAVQIRSKPDDGSSRFANFDNGVFAALEQHYRPVRAGVMGQYWEPRRAALQ